uniref:Uncharacterized protein n=1 Tax=Aegilops tauschii subsp. strangulata TaxID=200361 RepID=A0A453E9H2_AEGTS
MSATPAPSTPPPTQADGQLAGEREAPDPLHLVPQPPIRWRRIRHLCIRLRRRLALGRPIELERLLGDYVAAGFDEKGPSKPSAGDGEESQCMRFSPSYPSAPASRDLAPAADAAGRGTGGRRSWAWHGRQTQRQMQGAVWVRAGLTSWIGVAGAVE